MSEPCKNCGHCPYCGKPMEAQPCYVPTSIPHYYRFDQEPVYTQPTWITVPYPYIWDTVTCGQTSLNMGTIQSYN